ARQVTYLDVPAGYADDSSTRARTQAATGDAVESPRDLPSEAVALIETGAYVEEPHVRGAEDRYAQRLAWLDGLAATRLAGEQGRRE
ncbi:MAG: hypothetical protein ACRDHE_03345, partial [Ktedonobacterales bacterium]